MSPKAALYTGILSGCLAIQGLLITHYCAVVKQRFDGGAFSDRIDPVEEGFEFPAVLRLVGRGPQAPVPIGKDFDLEFRLHNLSRDPQALPYAAFFNQRRRSIQGLRPSRIVEVLDEEGRLQPFPETILPSCGNHDPLLPGDFDVIPAGGSISLYHPRLRWKPSVPGVYFFQMAVDTRGQVPDSWSFWDAPVDPKAIPRLKMVPKGYFVSNVVTVEFVP